MKPRRLRHASLLRLYPRAWRERYGDELIALTDRASLGWSETFDIVRAAARERISVHGRMPAILFMTIGLLPPVALIAVSLSGLATVLAFHINSGFGLIALPSAVVRVLWLVSVIFATIYSFRPTTTTAALLGFGGLVFVTAVLNKWLSQTWLHPMVAGDMESWTALGRGDAMLFAVLSIEIWFRWATPRIDAILVTYRPATSR